MGLKKEFNSFDIKIVSIDFIDHGLLYDRKIDLANAGEHHKKVKNPYIVDYENPKNGKKYIKDRYGRIIELINAGQKYDPVEYGSYKNEPFTISGGKPLKMRVVIKVINGDKFLNCKSKLDFHLKALNIYGSSKVTKLKKSKIRAENLYEFFCETRKPLPKRLLRMQSDIRWRLRIKHDNKIKNSLIKKTQYHFFFILYGKPKFKTFYFNGINFEFLTQYYWKGDEKTERYLRNVNHPYITHARLDLAVYLIQSAIRSMGKSDVHSVARWLHAQFPHYRIKSNPNIDSKYHYPVLKETTYGPWAAWQFRDQGVECQAIARFMQEVFNIVGFPCKTRVVTVCADPRRPDRAIEGGMYDFRQYNVKYALADKNILGVLKNKEYIIGDRSKEANLPGLNSFEACLEVTDLETGRKLYYGGGAGIYKTMDDVLKAFNSMVRIEYINDRKQFKLSYHYHYHKKYTLTR